MENCPFFGGLFVTPSPVGSLYSFRWSAPGSVWPKAIRAVLRGLPCAAADGDSGVYFTRQHRLGELPRAHGLSGGARRQ